MSNYDLLINKLDKFIRKFYLSQLLKGVLLFLGLGLISFIAINVLEHQFYFSKGIRAGLFYGFIVLAIAAFVYWVVLPLLSFFNLGKVISHQKAAEIIGTHFGDVKDKLLNILQLKNQSNSQASEALINASINQKIEGIKLVPFTNAVDLNKNRQYIKYAAIPLVLLLGIIIMSPNLIPSSSNRLINNDVEFEKEAPFSFVIDNTNLEAVQFEDFVLEVKVEGEQLPNEAFINLNNFPYKLTKKGKDSFTYQFKNLQKSVDFNFESGGFESKNYELSVIPKPIILDFTAEIKYPSYLKKKSEILQNTGDLNIPAGTRINWNFETQNTDKIQLKFSNDAETTDADRKGDNLYNYAKQFTKSDEYKIYVSNQQLTNADSLGYSIKVVPDQYPTISATQFIDSSDNKMVYFLGDASDDYGLRSIYFHYNITNEKQTASNDKLPIKKGINQLSQRFDFTWNLNDIELNAGDNLSYYFEAWDNDGVNGNKPARTQTMYYRLPTLKELEDKADQTDEAIKDKMKDSLEDAKELKEEIDKMKDKMTQKKNLDWQDKNQVEKMLEKQQELQKQIEQFKEEFKENNEFKEDFQNKSESLQKKQEQLQKLMDELLSDEMKKLLEEMEKLMEEMDNEEMMENLEDMEMSNEQLERELDRMMELMKQLELEQKMEETIEDLRELAEEEEELSEETKEDNDGNLEEQQEKQEEIQEKFEEIQEDMKDIEEKAEELGHDTEEMKENEEKAEEAEQDMQESQEQMEQQQNQEAGEKQKDAAKKMEQMAQQMQMQMNGMQQEQQEEDMKAIRQLLENLIDMSIDQERVMNDFEETTVNNPNYTDLVQDQHKLKDDFKIIEDSIVALSKRVPQIESFVIKELSNVEANFDDSIENLEDRKLPQATANQQYVMTSVNNLALMLSETMEQMQQQMASSMPGGGMCNKPGGVGKGMGDMTKMQKQLNEQLKKMQEGMSPGSSGQGKKGEGGKGKSGMSKQMAKAAAQQAAIRQALKELNEKENKDGKGGLGDLEKLMEEMEETEEDIVNKNITREMIERQQQILNKMLEAEEAMKTRGKEEKRESQTGEEIERKLPPEIEEYLKQRESEIELYKTVPPSLTPYYKALVERYFQKISK